MVFQSNIASILVIDIKPYVAKNGQCIILVVTTSKIMSKEWFFFNFCMNPNEAWYMKLSNTIGFDI